MLPRDPRPVVGPRLALVLLLAAGCGDDPPSPSPGSPPPPAPAPRAAPVAIGPDGASVLTLMDYLAAGEERAARFLAESTDPEAARLSAAIARARDAVVRVRVHYGRKGSSILTDHGTGFLVDRGRCVLTAGHVLSALGTDPAAEVALARTDGTARAARALDRQYAGRPGLGTDLGLFQVEDAEGLASLEQGAPRAGALVAILGYPGRMGRNPDGQVVGDDHAKDRPLLPLVVVGRIREGPGTAVDPVAGCIPEGGMSGAPVVDAEGRAVAIQTGVTRLQDGEAITFRIDVTALGPPSPGAGAAPAGK